MSIPSMLHLVVEVCMPKMNEIGGGPGVPPSTLVYLREPHYVKKKNDFVIFHPNLVMFGIKSKVLMRGIQI